jgi:5-hydroxyisourate hydrolase
MLTTHVLDTYHGIPAAGVAVELTRLGETRETLVRTTTNAEGRCPQPLLSGDAMRPGIYELAFDMEAYFRAKGVKLSQPAFLTTVVIRIADAKSHYHVPLLASPWSYSTYRGS